MSSLIKRKVSIVTWKNDRKIRYSLFPRFVFVFVFVLFCFVLCFFRFALHRYLNSERLEHKMRTPLPDGKKDDQCYLIEEADNFFVVICLFVCFFLLASSCPLNNRCISHKAPNNMWLLICLSLEEMYRKTKIFYNDHDNILRWINKSIKVLDL